MAGGGDVGNGDGGEERLEAQRRSLVPDSGFLLVGVDRLDDIRGELYAIELFDAYRDALDAKKSRDDPGEYFILYRDAEGRCCHR